MWHVRMLGSEAVDRGIGEYRGSETLVMGGARLTQSMEYYFINRNFLVSATHRSMSSLNS